MVVVFSCQYVQFHSFSAVCLHRLTSFSSYVFCIVLFIYYFVLCCSCIILYCAVHVLFCIVLFMYYFVLCCSCIILYCAVHVLFCIVLFMYYCTQETKHYTCVFATFCHLLTTRVTWGIRCFNNTSLV